MLGAYRAATMSPEDLKVFDALVPRDHCLRRAAEQIDFERLRAIAVSCYSPDHGRPPIEPLFMIKILLLQHLYNLSDREVLQRAQTDVAFRFFLGLSLQDALPNYSSLSYFRGRLGEQTFRELFDAVVAQAIEQGLVKNRLRLTDASHVLADVAVPSTLALVAQSRDRLLAAAEAFDADRVAGERARLVELRSTTQKLPNDQRLVARVTHLHEILEWTETIAAPLDEPEQLLEHGPWRRLVQARELVRKILGEHADPQAEDRTRSVTDPDVRRGRHGEFFDGYKFDILMDADSEIITGVDVLSATAGEAACRLETGPPRRTGPPNAPQDALD